jgi:hypothetical protein
METDSPFVSKRVDCPNGHRIRLEILSSTTNMMRTIECPICRFQISVFAGDIRGVIPLDDESADTGSNPQVKPSLSP